MVAWLRARAQGGRLILRIEDLDHPKDKPGAAAQAVADLRWLGFDWDEEFVQSRRKDRYRAALNILRDKGLVYPCVCSRRDVESAQSAPHAGEQLFYPGTCRDRFDSWAAAWACRNSDVGAPIVSPCWRFRVPDGTVIGFDDVFAGPYVQDVSRVLGDFPLARDEDGAGYTLAVVVDDLEMGVTEVVRGDDLLPATPSQILIASHLSSAVLPAYLHLPLVVGSDGKRLAKRHGDTRIASFRAAGLSPAAVIGRLAASCGWAEKDESLTLPELLPRFDLSTIPHTPFMV